MENLDQAAQESQVTSDPASDTGHPKRLDFEAVLERARTAPVMPVEEITRRIHANTVRRQSGLLADFFASCGERLANCRLGNYRINNAYQRKVFDTVTEWVLSFQDRQAAGEGLVLYGPVGTGKDHFAVGAVGAVVHAHMVSARWVNGRQVFAECRDRIGREESERDFIDSLVRPKILIISDPIPTIGDLTQYQADTLYRICDGRYGRGLITVLTINVASDEEADRRLGAATWDRLCHNAWKIACMWESFRKPAMEVKP